MSILGCQRLPQTADEPGALEIVGSNPTGPMNFDNYYFFLKFLELIQPVLAIGSKANTNHEFRVSKVKAN